MNRSRRSTYGYPYPWEREPMGWDYYMRRGGNTFFNTLRSQLGLYDVTDKVVGKITSKALEEGKNYFGTQFNFKAKDSVPVIKWIAEHDSKFKFHINNPQVIENGMNSQVINQISIANKEFLIKLDKGTFAWISSMDQFHKYSDAIFINNSNNGEDKPAGFEDMTIYIFGKKMRKYSAELAGLTNAVVDDLCQYIVMGGKEKNEYSITAKEINPRPLDSLFFDNDIKKKITNHIDKWLENESLYRDRSLLFKTGILLEGEPGTGKSSLVVALASAYNMEIVNINMPSFQNIDIDRVIESINADNNKYIVLLEEIDCVFNTANRDDDKIDKDDKTFISDLLQFIDSPKSPNNVIFIATTNYPEKLDKALTRKGRFDLTVDVSSLHTKESVVKMCKSFELEDDMIEDILQKNPLPITQSSLQAEILQRIKKKTSEDTKAEDDISDEEDAAVYQDQERYIKKFNIKNSAIEDLESKLDWKPKTYYFRSKNDIPETATKLGTLDEGFEPVLDTYYIKRSKAIYICVPDDMHVTISSTAMINAVVANDILDSVEITK